MPSFSIGALRPTVHPGAWIAPTACVVGDVTIEDGVSVWFNAVVRADAGKIVIRRGANVQDCAVLHGGPEVTEIGVNATIGHSTVVHGAQIGDQALIGNHATVLDGAVVGPRAMVAAGAVVSPGRNVPRETLAVGAPARIRGPLSDGQWAWVMRNPTEYRKLTRMYAGSLVEEPARSA